MGSLNKISFVASVATLGNFSNLHKFKMAAKILRLQLEKCHIDLKLALNVLKQGSYNQLCTYV